MAIVLLSVDDPVTQAQAADRVRTLGHAPEFAEGVNDIVARLRSGGVDVLVADLDLAQRQGTDLVRTVKLVAPDTRLLLLGDSATAQEYKEAIKQGAVELLTPPYLDEDLDHGIRRALECDEGFLASMHGLSLIDVLQMIHLSRRSVVVCLGSSGAGIHLRDGEIIHALAPPWTGEKALERLLTARTGSLSTAPLESTRVTINQPFEPLLLDILRRIDEKARDNPEGVRPWHDTDQHEVVTARGLGEFGWEAGDDEPPGRVITARYNEDLQQDPHTRRSRVTMRGLGQFSEAVAGEGPSKVVPPSPAPVGSDPADDDGAIGGEPSTAGVSGGEAGPDVARGADSDAQGAPAPAEPEQKRRRAVVWWAVAGLLLLLGGLAVFQYVGSASVDRGDGVAPAAGSSGAATATVSPKTSVGTPVTTAVEPPATEPKTSAGEDKSATAAPEPKTPATEDESAAVAVTTADQTPGTTPDARAGRRRTKVGRRHRRRPTSRRAETTTAARPSGTPGEPDAAPVSAKKPTREAQNIKKKTKRPKIGTIGDRRPSVGILE